MEFAEVEVFLDLGGSDDTRNEKWTTAPEEVLWYAAAMRYAVGNLGKPNGNCLVIGSPIFEASALEYIGWNVTLLDIRQPPQCPVKFVRGDVCRMPFADDTFDAISSTCVLCHAGLGRYGDPVVDDGDRKAMAEIVRVLKPRGKAAIMFGPSIPLLTQTVVQGRVHRVYCPNDVLEMASVLKRLRSDIWFMDRWLDESGLNKYAVNINDKLLRNSRETIQHSYLSMLLEKTSPIPTFQEFTPCPC